MNITVKIETVDKTSLIAWESFRITDNINEKVNTCNFKIKKHAGQTYAPSIQDEIEVTDGADVIFSGVIIRITKSLDKSSLIETYDIECSDWSYDLDRFLVTESYTNDTVENIIADILDNYASGFTYVNVDCNVPVSSIRFNNITISQCLRKLAEAVNYFWYVDYEKDIHFFSKSKELASFGLTDTNDKYNIKSLSLTDDSSQLKTKVRIQGGEIEGSSRTETFNGDGTKKYFRLANKFSSKPAVEVGGVTQDVGIDYLDEEADVDCLWSYGEKYVRFKDSNPPTSGTDNVEVTGLPLIPIIVEVDDDESQNAWGIHEYFLKDTNIKTVDEAKQRAVAELEAYASLITEGSFETQEDGLRSGQVINVQSTLRGISADYLIQSVSLRMMTIDEGLYLVKIASMRTLGIIYFLQMLLLNGKGIKEEGDEVLYKYRSDYQNIEVIEEIVADIAMQDYQDVEVAEQIRKDPWTAEWVLGPYIPADDNDNKRPMRLNISSYLY
jgi:hypothetical protein